MYASSDNLYRLRADYSVLVSETSATPLLELLRPKHLVVVLDYIMHQMVNQLLHDPGGLLVISLLSLGLVVSLLRLSQARSARAALPSFSSQYQLGPAN